MKKHRLTDGERRACYCRSRNVIGSVRDCGSSTRPNDTSLPAGRIDSAPGTSIWAPDTDCARATCPSGMWPTTWIDDGIHQVEERRAGADVHAGGGRPG